MQDFPIIIISLKDSKQRREQISDMLSKLKLRYMFYDAIDGREQLPSVYESQIDRELTIKRYGLKMQDSEYACALSHLGVYEMLGAQKLSGAVVLEDDAILGTNFKRFYEEEHYRKFNWVFLAHSVAWAHRWSRRELFPGGEVWKLATNPAHSSGYSIKVEIAEYISRQMKPVAAPVDVWPCDVSSLEAYIAHPSIVGRDHSMPSTRSVFRTESHVSKNRPNRTHWKMKRMMTAHYWNMKLRKIIGKRIPPSNNIV